MSLFWVAVDFTPALTKLFLDSFAYVKGMARKEISSLMLLIMS